MAEKREGKRSEKYSDIKSVGKVLPEMFLMVVGGHSLLLFAAAAVLCWKVQRMVTFLGRKEHGFSAGNSVWICHEQ